MSHSQKQKLTQDCDKKAVNIMENHKKAPWNVQTIENIGNNIVEAIKTSADDNSEHTEEKIPSKNNIWKNPKVMAQSKRCYRAKMANRAKPVPDKFTKWKKEEATLQQIQYKTRSDIFKGSMDQITTTKDTAKIVKYTKQGRNKEITLTKNKDGILANTPEDQLRT